MAEYIERQSVYDVLRKAPISNMGTKLYIYDDIADIPAANVVERELYERALSDVIDLSMKQKTGKWINMMGHSICNVCGYKGSPILTNYCPNCGAAMKGE